MRAAAQMAGRGSLRINWPVPVSRRVGRPAQRLAAGSEVAILARAACVACDGRRRSIPAPLAELQVPAAGGEER